MDMRVLNKALTDESYQDLRYENLSITSIKIKNDEIEVNN